MPMSVSQRASIAAWCLSSRWATASWARAEGSLGLAPRRTPRWPKSTNEAVSLPKMSLKGKEWREGARERVAISGACFRASP